MKNLVLSTIGCLLFILPAFGQNAPRIEDHFWRRKVVNRIDLNEKINFPLIYRESKLYVDNGQFPEKNGVVVALFNGLRDGLYQAYDPDSLNKPLTWEDVRQKIREFDGKLTGEGTELDEDTGDGSDFEDFPADGGDDFEEDDFDGGFDEGDFGDDFDTVKEEDDLDVEEGPAEIDFGPYEQVIQFVENRIFDKVSSNMVYDIEFIQIIWTAPGDVVPEEYLVTFRYKDVLPMLEATQWKNRFNDAEYRNLREAFELRLFHSYITEVSGDGMQNLAEAEYRRQKLVEFEHHLWSY